ncbi:hypothetical protein Dsin_023499 [Dipteronia sinensis]|uniref:Pectinesterase inhibitor domain-containing protein n=1 Tax=Dipteronia sinensis TaxID=43782 RepID=A0AAE0A4J8_9ROSI|nr:hypothetical protein Dsin_023499 [Dipteronia sinensis]
MSSLNHLLLLSNCFFFFLQFQQCFSINVPPLINTICTPFDYYDACVQTLNSAPGAATANLTTLADYSFKSTYATVATTAGFLYALLQTVTDPGVKQVVTHCRTNYDGSIPPLQSAITGLVEGASQFDDVNLNIYLALRNIYDCDRVVKIGPPPPGLPDKSTKAKQLVDISDELLISFVGLTWASVTNLDGDDYHEVYVKTHIALENVNDCDRVIKQGPPPPAPGAATADLQTLGAFSLKSTNDAVTDTSAYLMALLPNVTDPNLKQVGTHCKTDYDGSIPPLQMAIASLNEGHFDDVSTNVNQALANINDCDRVMKIGPRPIGLPEKHTNIVQLIDISNVISVMLLPPPGLQEKNTNVVQPIDISN